ncbi:hypothetical protein [Bacillus alkalicola]|uniref:Uncharacterized protein n=1 Tax=Evansella alkalicola TaxID=745819 RepID=A0ABS6JQV9_9BACI|nr:hypothetical protein [Bacillus alkalicola]MBU9720943.1 hypothetical protein [Bacillus alkalicola]
MFLTKILSTVERKRATSSFHQIDLLKTEINKLVVGTTKSCDTVDPKTLSKYLFLYNFGLYAYAFVTTNTKNSNT